MSDYRVKVTIRNAKMLRAIDEAGYQSQAEFARDVPMSVSALNALVAMREAPIGVLGSFSPSAVLVMEALGASPSDLWTEDQLYAKIGRNTAEADISTDEALNLFDSSGGIGRLEDMDSAAKLTGILMEALTPREKSVLEHRMNGETLEEAGKHFDVSRERLRQIEAEAYRKMRNKARTLPDADRPTDRFGICDKRFHAFR